MEPIIEYEDEHLIFELLYERQIGIFTFKGSHPRMLESFPKVFQNWLHELSDNQPLLVLIDATRADVTPQHWMAAQELTQAYKMRRGCTAFVLPRSTLARVIEMFVHKLLNPLSPKRQRRFFYDRAEAEAWLVSLLDQDLPTDY